MSNRLIWSLIILTLLISGASFYYYWKTSNLDIKKIQSNDIEIKKVILKKIKEPQINILQKNNSIFISDIEIKKELKQISEIKFKKNIARILKIDNFENIKIQEIYWEKNKILIKLSENKSKSLLYIYNKKTLHINNIDFSIPIIYAKKDINNNLYFVTAKWIFKYSLNSKLIYSPLFNDYIMLDWDYIWLIKNNDISKKINLNFQNEDWDLIILYNPKLNKKRLIIKTKIKIKKILFENNKVILNDEKNNQYNLSNF